MIVTFGFVRRFVFGLSLERLDYLWTLFPGEESFARKQLRQVTYAFVQEYNTALEIGPSSVLESTLEAIDPNLQGFACEGIGMAMTIIDYTTPWNRSRLKAFAEGAGAPHSDLVHVGAGFAMAIIPGGVSTFLPKMNPMQRWLSIDGLGCYHGMFNWKDSVENHLIPRYLTGYAVRAFDQGLGRSIWFGHSANIDAIVGTINAFKQDRKADLWSGIGVACTYAGGTCAEDIERLLKASGQYASSLSQGASIAARFRVRGGNLIKSAEITCNILCGLSVQDAAKLAEVTQLELKIDLNESIYNQYPIYEAWRNELSVRLMKPFILT
jgi:enediyne biosynthesis protein E3